MTLIETIENRRIRADHDGNGHFGLPYFTGTGSLYPPEYLDPESHYRYRSIDMLKWISQSVPSGKIADVGGGPGHLGYWAKKMFPSIEVTHLDISKEVLRYSRQIYPHQAINASAHRLPLADCTFDAILFADVLEHMQPPDAVDALKEAYRVVRPAGYIFINIPNRDTWTRKAFEEPSHLWIPTIQDAHTLITGVGFAESKAFTRGFPWSAQFRKWADTDMHLPVLGASIFIRAQKPGV